MIHLHRLAAALIAVVALSAQPPRAIAQPAQNWFMPGQPRAGTQAGGSPAAGARAQPGPRAPAAQPVPVPAFDPMQGEPEPDAALPQLQVQLPPPPDIPALPRGPSPPAAVIGIIAVPDVMRASSAAQQIERVIGERRQKLNADAQKEQVAWREIQQQIVAQRGALTPDQIRARERDLQGRISEAQRRFRDRNRIIQEAVQYSLAQIERTLSGVLQQIAASRGMNIILHRAQVALNVAEFDVSSQAVEELNTILPSVVIPPDGISPSAMPPVAQGGATGGAPPPGSTAPPATPPASAPPASASAPATAPAPAAVPAKPASKARH